MKKYYIIIYIGLVLSSSNLFAQNNLPEFKSGPIEFRFPSTLPGLMKDTTQKVKGELIYNLKGQKFNGTEGHIPTKAEGFDGKTNKSTPWETLAELTAAQQAKDYKAIVALYTPESKAEMDKVITADNKEKFLEYAGQIKTVNVLCGFYYKNGYVAIIDHKEMGGVSNVFFIKVGKKYMLSAIKESGPMIWNISLYYKFKPEPIKQPEFLNPFDSMPEGSSKKLTFKLSKPGNFLILFRGKLGEGIMMSAKDGMPADSNTEAGMIDITITNIEMNPGKEIVFYYAETNYPVTMVTDGLLSAAGTFKFRLYKR